MKTYLSFALLVLFCGTSFGVATVESTQARVTTAKSAQIIPMTDKVAVIMTGKDADEQDGMLLTVTSQDKNPFGVRVANSTGKYIGVKRTDDGRYLFIGTPGVYTVQVTEILPGPPPSLDYSDVDVTITGPIITPPPDKPPPPIGGFDQLRKVAKEQATFLNDPKTAKALASAYRNSVANMVGKNLKECQEIAQAARRTALLNRQGASRLLDWNSFLMVVDREVVKVVSSPETYQAAIIVIAEAIE